MLLSRFASILEVEQGKWYVYHNFMFEPVLMNEIEAKRLKQGDLEYFDNQEIEMLKTKGIIVESPSVDEEALECIYDYVNSGVESGIPLIYIIPCNTCNLACKYCFIGELNDSQYLSMDNETIENTVSKYVTYLKEKQHESASIIFYGAEPLIAIDVIERISFLFCEVEGIKFDFSIVTNATLISQRVIDWMKKYNVSVGVSIDGPKELNDINRVFKTQNNSVYDCVYSNITLLKTNNINFGLSVTLTKDVIHDDNYLDWLKSLDIKSINFNLLHFTEPTDEWEEYYLEATDFLFKAHDYLSQFGIVDDRLQRKMRAFTSSNFKYNDCGAVGGNQLCVAPNGDVTVCHGYWHSNKERCGNINVNSFAEIITHENFVKWQRNLTVLKEECLRCPAIYICGGGCAMQSGTIFESQFALDKGFCTHTKQTLIELFRRSL